MMKIFYQMDLLNDFDPDREEHYFRDQDLKGQKNYCRKIYQTYCDNRDEIDRRIQENSSKWKLSRMPKTDLAILRVATVEILFMEKIPDAVAANEAVELAKVYGTEESPRFINAILGSIIRGKTGEA
jgi:N utilization substance protein B